MSETGNNIRRARKAKGLTQKKLGELSGINEVQIRQYELGRANPKIETLEKIADALECSPETLRHEKFKMPQNLTRSSAQYVFGDLEESTAIGILADLKKLNDNGKKEAEKRVEELTRLEEYRLKDETSQK